MAASALDSIDGLRAHLPDENVLRDSDMSASSGEGSPRHDAQHIPVAAPDAPPEPSNPRVRFAQSHAPPAAPVPLPSGNSAAAGSSRASTMIAMLQRYGYDLEDLDETSGGDITTTNSAGILLLRERKNHQTAFHIAVKKGHVDVLKALMKLPRAEEFVNVGDKHGNTPLHFVASKDASAAELQTSLGTLLLSMGANLHATNVRGQTPLEVHIMTAKADTSVFVKLISFRGMQLNNLVGNGTTYLHMAIVDRSFPDMAGALVNAGASINIPDHSGVMVSDAISRQTLVRLTKFMREGTQAPPADVPRLSCKLCKNPKSLLDALRDCHICGRSMCRNCSKKLGDIKDPDQAAREKLDKEALAVRLCATCCTVTQLRDKKVAEQKKFAESLFGMNRV
ncbi:hypothetical protein H257_10599 [Aphanomyces astaci]|uniref:Uncharacterized protein n=1 Tax=Aphanomyces astaci TaxID=112090 RepID=W4G5P0_APHAT|nr:hypothetical protein H257_10599 [Aphanomyces astaci]ETV74995.1 hypothetical protein H257_10599 [Aphanomyces astaci]RQM12914.1 hypothetical protein B5M09_012477 [Aphanomyces astaci]|eukprot:XP_009835499.1 hypothetical protein H257_10599 [Aphanomyces astaci]